MTIAMPGTAALGAAATLLILSACGGSADAEFVDQSPRAITRTAFAEMANVTTVRLLGTVDVDGRRVRMDVSTDNAGNCLGSFMLAGGGTKFIRTDDTTWLQPDEDYWKALAPTPQQARKVIAKLRPKQPPGTAQLDSAWTLAPGGTVDVDQFCNASALLDGFEAYKDGGSGRLSKDSIDLIGDTQAIAVNEKGNGQSSTVWVSVAAPHHVVKIVKREKGVAETVSLEEFGIEVNAEPPAEDDVVDVSAYLKKK